MTTSYLKNNMKKQVPVAEGIVIEKMCKHHAQGNFTIPQVSHWYGMSSQKARYWINKYKKEHDKKDN